MYSINFRLRSETLKTPKRKIYIRIKINGVCCSDIASSISINPDQWDKQKQTIKGNSVLDYTNRAMLLQIESDIIELIRSNPSKSAKQIRALYIGKELPPATLFSTYQRYIKEKKECWNGTSKELAKNTIQRWYNCLEHLKEFLKQKDIELNAVDIDFGNRLYLYLIKKKKKRNKTETIGHDYAVRNLTYLVQVLDFAKTKCLIPVNVLDIDDYKRNPPKEIESLNTEQLRNLETMRFTGVLEDARILFLSMTYSGLNYCDLPILEKLKDKESIVLKIDRQKNERHYIDKAIVPIITELRDLLETYEYKLPKHDINVVNRHLHVFEGLLGVTINITTYTARKTAAMLLSERGVSIDVISKILGHSSINTTQRYYVKISEKRVIEETKHLTRKNTLNIE